MFETIVALATPPVKSALAIVRLSGDDCFEIVQKCFSHKLILSQTKSVQFGYFLKGNAKIDQIVLINYVYPHSFTGENAVEIICHGSMLIVNDIIETLLSGGARMATNGEFSSRAFLNGKIDLVQAEAINDLINATSEEARELSLISLQGETSKMFWPIKERIADLLSQIEVNIDYPEYEDIEQMSREKTISLCSEIIEELNSVIALADKNRIIQEGVKIAIVGKPNVGKSSLLNALIGENKAIVTDIAGTTRDIVEGTININGVTVHLYDTAGYRNSTDIIEKIGIQKAAEIIKNCDLVIYVADQSGLDESLLKSISKKKCLIVYNKSDINNKRDADKLYVSALKKDVTPLLNAIKKTLCLENFTISASFTNTRQIGILKNMKKDLQLAKTDAQKGQPIDLVSSNIMLAYNASLELLGLDNKNDLTKEIFARFCVGK